MNGSIKRIKLLTAGFISKYRDVRRMEKRAEEEIRKPEKERRKGGRAAGERKQKGGKADGEREQVKR